MWQLKKEKKVPIYQSIVKLILSYIDTEQLQPGERLPSERKLASYFEVNRTTVVHALDELVAMGVIVRKPGSGTRVTEGKWGVYRGSEIDWRRYLSQPSEKSRETYAQKVALTFQERKDQQLSDGYTADIPMKELPAFPTPDISWEEMLRLERTQDGTGYGPLREALIKRMNTQHQLAVQEANLLLTPSSQQAILLLVQVLLNAGDGIAIESPSSFYQLSIFQAAGIRVYDIPVDEEGMRVDLLEEQIRNRKIKLVLANPNCQNPTGTTMSLPRRKELLAVCRKYKIPIVEDDVFGDLYFQEESRLPLLKTLDPDNVIYISSFSKTLGPTAKIGWVCGPAQVLRKMLNLRTELDLAMSILPQIVVHNALKSQDFNTKLGQLRERLSNKMLEFTSLMDQQLGAEADYFVPQGGCYMWLTLRAITLSGSDYDDLLTRGVMVTPGFLLGQTAQSMRINVSRLSEDEAQHLIYEIKLLIARKKNTIHG